MPLSQNDDAISLVDLNNPTQQIAFASGSTTSTGSLGFIALGVTPSGVASFVQLDASGLTRVTGSVSMSGTSNVTGSLTVANTVTTLGFSEGITGSLPPSRSTFVAGFDSSSGFIRAFSVDSTGKLNVNATAAGSPNVGGTGSVAPTSASLDGGVDGTGVLRPFLVDSGGRLLVQLFNTGSVTGSVGISGIPTVTGSITVPNTVTVTGSLTIGSPIVSSINAVRVSDPHPDSTSTTALNALNAAVTLDMSGSVGCGFQLAAGTLVGTLTPEMSFDGGTTWIPTGFYDVDTKGISETVTVSSNTQTKSILLPAGAGLARVRVSAFTSGTSNGTLRGSQTTPQVIYNSPIDGRRSTYAAATAAFASAASATDIFIIQGSATKTIRILAVKVFATQTTAAAGNIFFLKRSTANTGAAIATTRVPLDSQSPAATATVQHYTANPTALGTLVGNIDAYRGIIPASATLINNPIIDRTFGDRPGSAIVLRGTNELFAVNLNGVTVTGGSFIISCEWTEE